MKTARARQEAQSRTRFMRAYLKQMEADNYAGKAPLEISCGCPDLFLLHYQANHKFMAPSMILTAMFL